jgi:hypothetical protein
MNGGINMVKQITLVALLMGLMAPPASLRAGQSARLAQFALRCLHGPSEQRDHRLRREQALTMAERINRAESVGRLPLQPRRYRPFDQLQNVPPRPADFRLQFYTDGPTYTFSLKDTLDPCHYAIFSDQDKGIYQATTDRPGVRVVPAEIP